MDKVVDFGLFMAQKAPKMSAIDMQDAYARYKDLRKSGLGMMEACGMVGEEIGREEKTVYMLIRRLEPTIDVSQAYIQAQALRLAMRIVRKANVAEAVDILSRRNIGVLAPKQEEGSGGGGFFLSVSAESCGAIKIGVASAAKQLDAPLPSPPTPAFIDVQPTQVEQETEPHEEDSRPAHHNGSFLKRGAEISESARKAIENARQRLDVAKRRRVRKQGDGLSIRARIKSLAESDEQTGGSE